MRKDMLERMERNAQESSCFLNPDREFVDDLINGLVTNEERYGYASCPCRVACGIESYDADIICPCEYRDADVAEFGACFCALFVSREVHEGMKIDPVPERRPIEVTEEAEKAAEMLGEGKISMTEFKVTSATEVEIWRCSVCGYLCARKFPPNVCPICKAPRERFERFSLGS
ncbi:MAG: ferredoxin-thioredoxin reductase catalytic domain-containing protein [Thermoplasmata archaeon]